ncbi:stalk domain-containing protein [Paenibacillus donghaensis]|uniref:Copper amine oxidase-like N-terminal domain-containing protein n=1 Tax=Paenibacillus donghaensis TaxID=414771 RepID=A0A2Z2KR15_9BACL|nr:stalk domain-containing protein [Paenibacillus donghaensis]ASA23832.1 hypothetical protein B9T62_25450 [Paenibacillus donghaensis]
MNSKWLSVGLVSALLVTAGAGSVSAASGVNSGNGAAVKVAVQPAVKAGTGAWTVNGTPVVLSTIDSGGYKLYSLSELADELGANLIMGANSFELNDSKGLHNVHIQLGSKSYQVDGAAQEFTVAPVTFNNKTYVELTRVVEALGGELQADEKSLMSFARPEGGFDGLRWTAAGYLIANSSDAEAATLFRFSTQPGNYEVFSSNESAADFAVSKDGQWGAFNDGTGILNLMNLNNGVIRTLGTDNSVKTDLVWSQDGTKILFIQGDKQEKIASISVETGEVKSVLADKVENKSELRISADGKAAVYIVNVTGVAKNDADSTEDSLTVDFSKAGEQLFKLDLTAKDAKPAALTTTPDNKLYPEILADGSIVYLSADPEGNTANTLKTIQADGTIVDFALDAEATWSTGVNGGLVVSGLTADGGTIIYSITNGARTELFRTAEDVSEAAVSQDGSKLAVVSGGLVWTVENGKATQLTK